jgi:hypothetical protein
MVKYGVVAVKGKEEVVVDCSASAAIARRHWSFRDSTTDLSKKLSEGWVVSKLVTGDCAAGCGQDGRRRRPGAQQSNCSLLLVNALDD